MSKYLIVICMFDKCSNSIAYLNKYVNISLTEESLQKVLNDFKESISMTLYLQFRKSLNDYDFSIVNVIKLEEE